MSRIRYLAFIVLGIGLAACAAVPPSDGNYTATNTDSDSGSTY